MTEHDCNQCQLLKACTRHPLVNKTRALGAICRGEGDPTVRARWMRQWDIQAGIEPEPLPRVGCPTCGPGIVQRGVNAIGAAARFARAGAPRLPPQIAEERRRICGTCEMNKDGWCQHIKCGCNIAAKTLVATESCPLEKWTAHTPTRPQGQSGYIPTTEIIPDPRLARVVVTVATGDEFAKVLALTRPFMENYAARCDADFIALTNPTQSWPMYEKFRVGEVAKHYSQTLFVDADCLVKPTCENLFEIVPSGHIGMHNDVALNSNNQWVRIAWNRVTVGQGTRLVLAQPLKVLNSGVVLCDRSTAHVWDAPIHPLPRGHEDEQVFIQTTIQERNVPVYELSRRFNEQWYAQRTEPGNSPEKWDQLASVAGIIHFARCRNRLNEIKKWIERIEA